jgi:hypothetical protein
MNLFAIDPGKHLIGFAHFRDTKLVECTVIEFKSLSMLRATLWEKASASWPVSVVSEVPQVYPGFQEKVPDDMIDMALAAGACLSLAPNTLAVRPHAWKGSKDKKIHQAQLLNAATPDEFALINQVPKALRHNAIDAYGIGKWYLNRFMQR